MHRHEWRWAEWNISSLSYLTPQWVEANQIAMVISLALAPTRDVKTGSWSYNQQAKVIKWFEMNRSAWSHSEQLQTEIINVFRTVLFVNWQRLTGAKSKGNESKKNAASESDLSRIITSQTYQVIEVLKKVLSLTNNDCDGKRSVWLRSFKSKRSTMKDFELS